MHIFGIKSKDNFQRIAQLSLVGEILHTSLAMISKNYLVIRIQISTKIQEKPRTGLKIYSILKGTWNPKSLNKEISISIKKEFIYFWMRIMPNNKCKAIIDFLLYNGTYFFTYDMKTTKLREFSDLKIFYVKNFQVCTNVAVELQLQF